ncbi:putative phosphatase phospho1 isoform X1 [Alosa pseudoharengus]|uniref:putative phosphatase phospho1 isoform X1 n=2 Tax=Alosa pseudoharengus TaxID=34774 RepID=UPI003F8AE46B
MRDSVFNCCFTPAHPSAAEVELPAHRHRRGNMAEAPPPNDRRFLIFFDFDETLVDETSDDMVVQAAPGGVLPGWLKDTYRPNHYNEYMQRVLAYLAEQGVSEATMRSIIEKIPACPGIPALLRFLQSRPPRDFEVVCVSDANTYFIESWLTRAGFRPLFLRVFTNPAQFDRDGQLQLRPYHSHECQRCPSNFCKAVVVREYITRRVRERGGRPFQRVFYVGDGANDFCPSLTLSPRDTVFPRRDFPMHRLIQEMAEAQPGKFRANVVTWASGEDVINTLRKVVEERG